MPKKKKVVTLWTAAEHAQLVDAVHTNDTIASAVRYYQQTHPGTKRTQMSIESRVALIRQNRIKKVDLTQREELQDVPKMPLLEVALLAMEYGLLTPAEALQRLSHVLTKQR